MRKARGQRYRAGGYAPKHNDRLEENALWSGSEKGNFLSGAMTMEKREIIILGVGLLVLVTSIVVGKAIELVELRYVVVGAALTLLILWISVVVTQAMAGTAQVRELEALARRVSAIMPAGFDWLFEDAQVTEIAMNVKGKDIWIVSPDLSHVTLTGKFRQSVQHNVKRGIRYTYIVPSTEAILALVPDLRHVFAQSPSKLRLNQIPKDVFQAITVTHIAIYNPNMEDDSPLRVFLELPIARRGYWVEVQHDAALALAGRFRQYAEP